MLASAPGDPEEVGVSTALERAGVLHLKVKDAIYASNDYYAYPSSPITDTEQKALYILKDKLGALEDRLHEYRLIHPGHYERRNKLLSQLDVSRRDLLAACRQCMHHSDNCHELVTEVLAFCEVSASEQVTPRFYDFHQPPKSAAPTGGQQQINFKPVKPAKALEHKFAAVSEAREEPQRDAIVVPRFRTAPRPAVMQEAALEVSASESGSDGFPVCEAASPLATSAGKSDKSVQTPRPYRHVLTRRCLLPGPLLQFTLLLFPCGSCCPTVMPNPKGAGFAVRCG